jgi:glycosyltransferase involved in cell wall biosynthesis
MPVVYFNGRFLSQRQTGVQRFALELIRAIDRLSAHHGAVSSDLAFVVLAPPNAAVPQDMRNIEFRRVGVMTGYLWDQIELPIHAWNGLLVSPGNTGPVLHPRHVAVLHDASTFASPSNFSPLFASVNRLLHPMLARSALRLITVSAFSRGELARWCRVPEDKFDIVPCGADHILAREPDTAALAGHGIEPQRYLLAVGSVSPNKNLGLALEAFRRLNRSDIKLVVVGADNPKVFADPRLGSQPGVVALGYVPDAALRALYENALCLVFPSLYEGFGIPPQEAMLCGCPVIVSDTPALRETCRDAALYCDPHDPDQLAGRIAAVAGDEALRRQLHDRGLVNAGRYTWSSAAERTLHVLRSVLHMPVVTPA